jgi:hypothetical protein
MTAKNTKVKTPIGEGVSQGRFQVLERGTDEVVEECVLVQFVVTDEIRPHMTQDCCMTPYALKSALFVFPLSEVTS